MRFKALDSWRGICALLVAAHHLQAHGFLYWQPLVRNAWLFVDFFFVLSGFVMSHAYGEELGTVGKVKEFIIRRLGRIWPLHVAVLAALIGLEFSRLLLTFWHPFVGVHDAFSRDRTFYAVVTNLFLVQALGFNSTLTWNGPAWSISVEFWTYLIFAALVSATPRRSTRLVLSLILAATSVAILEQFSQYGMRETFQWALPRCVYGFFSGTIVYELWRRGTGDAVAGTVAESVTVMLVLVFVTFVPGHAELEYLATPLFCFAVLVFAGARGLLSRALTLRGPAALGRWSYSIYMVHTLVLAVLFSSVRVTELFLGQHWLKQSDGSQPFLFEADIASNVLVFVLYFAVTVAVSAATWRFIELPGQRFFAALAGAKSVTRRARIA